ncbi:D-galactarate dehydratase / Altronate hydrolase, C terminus [Salegentibacter agarivorans]|uniref:D-galactarate dehydratase / Altronate hydrolase, C terminus n=1 Tax=Salegentibacter agarivorans TaxID=345907 RepID=A0A1I2KNP5_9FLAO|nr:D-galactarate dehydratase / Altronate hydrolase, C terminus [Salegentibacter agarivorans]
MKFLFSVLRYRFRNLVDFSIIRGERTIEETGEEILEYIIKVASGEVVSKADHLNQDDLIPWKRGVSL